MYGGTHPLNSRRKSFRRHTNAPIPLIGSLVIGSRARDGGLGTGAAPAPKLSKDERGVWSVTLGPFEPSIYIYSFNVDGVAIPDPVNPRIKLRARTSASMVEVKDDTPAFWEPRDVPHGAVEINWEKSRAISGRRHRQ